MRFVAVAVVAALLCFVAMLTPIVEAAPTADSGEGAWSKPNIARLENGTFSHNHTLHAVRLSNGTWGSFVMATKGTPQPTLSHEHVAVCEVLRNPAENGWDYLHVRALTDTDAFFVAGYAEALLTYEGMYAYWFNMVLEKQQAFENPNATNTQRNETAVRAFLLERMEFERTHDTSTAMGRQIRRQFRQMEGLAAGWNAAYEAAGRPSTILHRLNITGIYLSAFEAETDDMLAKFDRRSSHPASLSEMVSPLLANAPAGLRRAATAAADPRIHDRCSAIVKVHGSELFFAHTTWYVYNSMVRQYKRYTFPQSLGVASIRMSSYPGVIASTDDWYLTSHGLAVTETTLDVQNSTLYALMPARALSTFQRSVAASYLAATPHQWAEMFGTENSGMCNDQWLVAQMQWAHDDLGHSRPMRAGTFVVVEQTPGKVFAWDKTAYLHTHGYWASYNFPSNATVIHRLNMTMSLEARPKIFARMHSQATNASSLFYLMRYNNYAHDPLSTAPFCRTAWNPNGTVNCPADATQLPVFAISARADLGGVLQVPNSTTVLRPFLFGGIDSKVTTTAMFVDQAYATVAEMGPTAVQQQPFDFQATVAKYPNLATHRWRGIANRLDFAPRLMSDASVVLVPPAHEPRHDKKAKHGARPALIAVVTVLCLFSIIAAVIVGWNTLRDRHYQNARRYGAADENSPLA